MFSIKCGINNGYSLLVVIYVRLYSSLKDEVDGMNNHVPLC